jgi:hypothetical protein
MLRIMVQRTALDARSHDWVARVSHMTVRERRELANGFVDHLEETSTGLPMILDAGWDDIRAFALERTRPGFLRQLRAFGRRRKAKRRNRHQESRSN